MCTFVDIINALSGGQVEQHVDSFQLFLLDLSQVSLGVQAHLIFLYFSVKTLLLPHAICDFALKFGNVVLTVHELFLQESFFLRELVFEEGKGLCTLFFVLFGQKSHL